MDTHQPTPTTRTHRAAPAPPSFTGAGVRRLRRIDPGIYVLLLLFLLLLPISTPRIYATDEVQYFAYLRSVYFDGDLNFRNEYEHFAQIGIANGDPAIYNALLRNRADDPPLNPQTGMLRNVAPIGSALLWAPAYVLADGGVRLANSAGAAIPTDGYARPYIQAVCLMSALYALLGMLLTYRLTRRYAGVLPATLTVVTLWLATPLVFYSFIAMPWSHAPGFFLVALFLTVWIGNAPARLADRYAQRPLYIWAMLGIIGGLMASTREQLGLLMLLPAVEGLYAYARLLPAAIRAAGQERSQFWRLGQGHALFLVCLLLTLLPQLLTYQILNGRPLPSSTVAGKLGASGGSSPYFFATLIHPRHGALLWSPVLVPALAGLAWLARKDWLLAALCLLGVVVQTYINGSFGSTWHLTGAFGFRRLIECTPFFALGLAALLEWLRPRMHPALLVLPCLLLIGWNIGLIAQWTIVRPDLRRGLIWDDMLYYQFVEVPQQVLGRLGDLLFHRCRLVQNQTC